MSGSPTTALKLDTPSLKSWEEADGALRVYEPAQDTFLILDSLQKDADRFRARPPALCLEIGTGSGCVITFLGKLCQELARTEPSFPLPRLMATDINPHAVQIARATALENGLPALEAVCTDLVDGLLPEIAHKVDVLIFNPPYVPTEEAEFVKAQTTLKELLPDKVALADLSSSASSLASSASSASSASTSTSTSTSTSISAAAASSSASCTSSRTLVESTDPTTTAAVATEPEDVSSESFITTEEFCAHDDLLLSAAWAGGPDGRLLLDRFLPLVDVCVFFLSCESLF